MGMNSLPKTVTRQRRGYDFNPGRSAPESSALTTRLPSQQTIPQYGTKVCRYNWHDAGSLGWPFPVLNGMEQGITTVPSQD